MAAAPLLCEGQEASHVEQLLRTDEGPTTVSEGGREQCVKYAVLVCDGRRGVGARRRVVR